MKFIVLAGMLLGFPLLGIITAGTPLCQYLEFPPETRYVSHAPFSRAAFIVYGIIILLTAAPLFIRAVRAGRKVKDSPSPARHFPWWGRVGIVTGVIAWVLAWTRFSWFSVFQPHTFVPLWMSFILVVNGLTYRRKGRCMMVNRPGYFLLLFPASAVFWWFFEYLNRFVQNWFYAGEHFSSWEYFIYATLSFSTVLPAVLGTREWILSFSWPEAGFAKFLPLEFFRHKTAAWVVLLVSGAGLAGIGVWPDYLFPLVWVSPLLIIVSLQSLLEERNIMSDIRRGDWRLFISSAAAALFCGGFWEMWNFYSLARWEYAVPFVHRYRIFEMPVLGYAGYLPFGLECTVIGGMLERPGASASPSA